MPPSLLYTRVTGRNERMTFVLTILHVVVSILLVGVVLLQKSKGDGLSGAFGGGGALTASFGNTGAVSFLSRATTALAVLFMIFSFLLAII